MSDCGQLRGWCVGHVCDIDHFKSINDRFDDAVGDRVLRVVAETLDPNLVARFGDEEFVLLLPGVDGQTAFDLIEKARLVVDDRNFRVRETDEVIGQVTFSAGWHRNHGLRSGAGPER